jgi:hypothetical protein
MKTQKEKKQIHKKQTNKNDRYDDFVMRSGEVPTVKFNKGVGSYKIGRSFLIHFEQKPNAVHRFFSKVFLGWEWIDNK